MLWQKRFGCICVDFLSSFFAPLLHHISSMRRVHTYTAALCVLTGFLGLTVLLLGILFYQITPKSVLAQQTFIGRVQGPLQLLRVLDRSLNIFYRGPAAPDSLPAYALKLDPVQLRALENAIAQNNDVYLINEAAKQEVKGTFRAEGETYSIKAHVRGDRYNHWKFRKKSWRISFEDDHLFHGIKEMNLIIPEDRVWFAEVLSAHRADKFGLFHPPMQFVTASINGSGPALYLEVEHWTKEMLEKQARPGDVNMYKTGGIGTSSFNPGWDPIEADIAYWGKYQMAVAPPYDSYEEVAQLFHLSESGAHLKPHFKEQIDLLFDHEKLMHWYALSMLAGNLHVGGDNLRFFWDISRGRFEPIVWDISLTAPKELETLPGNVFWNEVFAVPEWKLEANRFLWAYIQDQASVDDDFQTAEELRASLESAAYRDPLKLQSNRQVKNDLEKTMQLIHRNIAALRTHLSDSVLGLTQRVPNAADQKKGILLTLDVASLGQVASALHAIQMPATITSFSLFHDDGDSVWDANDPSIILHQENGKWSINQVDATLLYPHVVATQSDAHVDLSAKPERFFLVSKGAKPLSFDALPQFLFQNAVTGEPSQIAENVLLRVAASSVSP